jgi:hypothetical protein
VTAAAYDIQLEQGETWNPVWTLTVAGGLPMNLVGYSAHLQVRTAYYSTAVLVDLHSNTGGLILGGAGGTVQPNLPASVSAGLLAGQVALSQTIKGRQVYKLGVYDLKLTDPGGAITTVMGGNVWIAPAITVGGI